MATREFTRPGGYAPGLSCSYGEAMRLTKYAHSCVLVEDEDARVLIDPGNLTRGFDDLTGLTGILITHQHADHVDVDRLGPLLERNPNAGLYADEATADILGEQGISASTALHGDRFDVGLAVAVYGVDHAVIHPEIPRVPNVGYLVGGQFFHPGDSFTVPDVDVEVLGLPTAAPWLKLSEAVEFLRAVAPRVAIPIHEALLAKPAVYYGHYQRLAAEKTAVTLLEPGGHTKV
jgi:L-ascorbate metabolism protein UlaG (beta-lactamase superfamily)